jgi:hypothetical protein
LLTSHASNFSSALSVPVSASIRPDASVSSVLSRPPFSVMASLLSVVSVPQWQIHSVRFFNSDVYAAFDLSPLESALTKSASVSPLESALTKTPGGWPPHVSSTPSWHWPSKPRRLCALCGSVASSQPVVDFKHEGGKSAVHPPKRSTRRSEGRGWRYCAVSLRITATGRNWCAERRRKYRARGVFRKIAFEISPLLHGPKGLAYFRCCFPGTAPLLTAGRVPTSQERICLILLRLRDKLAFRPASTRDPVPKRDDAGPIPGTTQT